MEEGIQVATPEIQHGPERDDDERVGDKGDTDVTVAEVADEPDASEHSETGKSTYATVIAKNIARALERAGPSSGSR